MRALMLEDRLSYTSDDAHPVPRIRSERRAARKWLVPLAGLFIIFAGFLAATALPQQSVSEAVPSPAAVVAAPPPAWIDIIKPVEMFGVAAPEFEKLPHSYFARRNRSGGGRQDFLSLGTLDGGAPYLRLSLYRVGSEPAADVPLYVDIARRAADAGLGIQKAATPYVVATRFGRFEAIDLELAGQTGLACTGMRLRVASPDLRVAGLLCGPRQKPTTAVSLTCLLERLDLNSAGEDVALARFFAASELSRNPACVGAAMAPTPLHAPWLDDAPVAPSRRTAAKPVGKLQANQRSSKQL